MLLTGRPSVCGPRPWPGSERSGLRWDLLVIRDRGNYERVTEFKRDTVRQLRRFGFDLQLAMEDDPSNHANVSDRGESVRLYPFRLLLRLNLRARSPAQPHAERRESGAEHRPVPEPDVERFRAVRIPTTPRTTARSPSVLWRTTWPSASTIVE